MKKFFVRIGFYFLCMFLMNLFFIFATGRSAGAIFVLVAMLVGEALSRAVLNNKDNKKKADDSESKSDKDKKENIEPDSSKKLKKCKDKKVNKWDALDLHSPSNDQEKSE